MLALRSLLWTMLLPGLVAGYIPWRFYGLARVQLDVTDPLDLLGLLLLVAGAALLATCIWEFATRGRGTLSPVDPPKELVVQGLYRYVRNPMYVAVTALIAGQGLLFGSVTVLEYGAILWAGFFLFVVAYEEPALGEQFADEYKRYRANVRRWLPRITPWRG